MKHLRLGLVCAAVFASTVAPLLAEEDAAPAVSASICADASSAYVWRGITLNNGIVVQPSVEVSLPIGLALRVWNNFNVDDYNGTLKEHAFSETDVTISCTREFGPVELTLGYVEYFLYNLVSDDGESSSQTGEIVLDAGVSLEFVEGLSVVAQATYDVDAVKGFYANVGLACELGLIGDALGIEMSGTIGYADKDWVVGQGTGGIDGGLHEYNLDASASYSVGKITKVGVSIGYTDNLDEDVLPEQDVDIYGGISVGVEF